MMRNPKWMLMILLAAFGVWGCSKGTSSTLAVDKVRQLEAQIAKLEEDMKALNAARDTFRVKLASAEQQIRSEAARATAAEKERDQALEQLKERVTERDQLRSHLENFRNDLKQLLGRTETALGHPEPSNPTVSITPVSLTK